KLGKGIKALNLDLTDEAGNRLTLRIGSSEWVLQEGVYVCTEEVVADKQYTASLQSSTVAGNIAGGNLEVTCVGETYFITGLLEMSDGQPVKCDYKGKLSFEIGEDDAEASGYTIVVTPSPVITYDEMGTPTFHSGILKYTFTVRDPQGNETASFDAINDEGLSTPDLVGSYTVQGSAAEAWLMDSGWVVPDWGMAGGSYYTDSQGSRQYIISGKITVAVAESTEGEPLYSFSGSELGTTTVAGDLGTGAFNIRFCTLL
ncbi:MAG: hypothetical protein LUF04_07495, partial [Bacteroides sp.]|nr:hypothetical protein [Bacteroides sp.]